MKAVLPVAGAGTRLRPLTHTLPKVLVHVAGKPIMGHILDALVPLGVDEIVLVLGQFGDKIVDYVKAHYDVKVTPVLQTERRGNGHAVYLCREAVGGDPFIIVFGDTLFRADLSAMVGPGMTSIAVKTVPNPKSFGVAETSDGLVTGLVEKPENPTTNLAVVGIYYIANAPLAFDCLREVMERDMKAKGEYQLTTALALMIDRGERIVPFTVDQWLDCGSPENLLDSNRRLLADLAPEPTGDPGPRAILIPPVAIGTGVTIENAIVGPYVSVADGATIRDSIVRDSIVNEGAEVQAVLLSDSIVGENAVVCGSFKRMSIGDSSTITGVS